MRKIYLFLLALIITLVNVISCSDLPAAQLEDKTWLSPGKIQVTNLASGGSVKQNLEIHNGNACETNFKIYYRIPDYVENNFITAPENACDWITINNNATVLGPGETKEIPIVLNLPEKEQTPECWEFWIGVKESNGNMLTTELCSRWLIAMKR